jgi:hypothetical protein
MRAREFVAESASQETFAVDQRDAIPDMEKFNALDNSNPYEMWRFIVAAAGEPYDGESFRMKKYGPTGQKFVTVAYTQADADIINATAKTLGVKGTHVTTKTSSEAPDTNITSPVKGFKGYPK